jgi:hypothetical protein
VRLNIGTLARAAAQVDLSDLGLGTRQTAPAYWDPDTIGVLVIPMDPEPTLTPAQEQKIIRRFKSRSNQEADTRDQLEAFLALASPTAAQNQAALRGIARLVLDLLSAEE